MKVNLTLSGGASKAMAHIYAVDRILCDYGLEINELAGASAGAIVAAMLSVGYDSSMIDMVFRSDEFKSFIKHKWRFINLSFFNPFTKSTGLFKLNKFTKWLRENVFNNRTFDDCLYPLTISTTNIRTMTTEYITSGDITDAVIQSMTFPVIFESNDMVHYDGGILENLCVPLHWKNMDDKVPSIGLCVSDVVYEDVDYTKNMFTFMYRLVVDTIWSNEYHKDKSKVDICLDLPTPPMKFFDFDMLDVVKNNVDSYFDHAIELHQLIYQKENRGV